MLKEELKFNHFDVNSKIEACLRIFYIAIPEETDKKIEELIAEIQKK
jgi:hypothetical protein